MMKILNFLIGNIGFLIFFAVIGLAMLRRPGTTGPSNLDDESTTMINPATGKMVLDDFDVDVEGNLVLR